jgi:hypothetical protein
MTERAYFLYLIGNRDLELKQAKEERQRLWFQLCSFADPKTMPKTIFEFMPLEGDPEKRQISSAEIMQADQLFRNLGKKKS